MKGITDFSIEKDRVTVLFLMIMAVAGLFAYLTYPKQEDPSIQIREAVVWAYFPGMPPSRVEDLITRKLEEQIRLLGDVDYIESDSKRGMSFMHVVARDEVPVLKTLWRDLRDKLHDVTPHLPTGTIGPFVNDEFGLTAVATIALWAEGFSLAEMRLVARDLRNELYSLKGIRRVEMFGAQDQRVFLELSNAKLAEFGISPGVVVETLRQQNIILPGGLIDVRGQNVVVEPTGDFDSIADIEDVIIPIPGTERVTPLRDLAKVSRGYVDPPNQPVYYNGRPAASDSKDAANRANSAGRLCPRLCYLSAAFDRGSRFGCSDQFVTDAGDRSRCRGAFSWPANRTHRRLICAHDHADEHSHHAGDGH
jgi:multidrug efflux pump subunit AcrB